ncbi:DEAD/DEAH box helicase [Rhodospirillales bacterium]|nr:DEAD/DEAH box helicase [Rhodospirillales bacterium]
MSNNTFSEIGLADPILRALTERKHFEPTPIQTKAIPHLIEGRDVLGIAQTGTGKTGAFALPLLHHLENQKFGKSRHPKALILAPTRELAIQIGDEFREYGKHVKARYAVIFGGVKQGNQVAALERGVDIIVATPGRLMDLHRQRKVSFDEVKYLVLDEADRMLDMGFVHEMRKIVQSLPKERQSLLFSATMPKTIAKISKEFLTDPIEVSVAPQATPISRIEQEVYHVSANEKRDLLAQVLDDPEMKRVIVFVRMKHRANRVVENLGKVGIRAEAIHGNKSQNARQAALKQFKNGQVRVLVATDIAARGIDVDSITHVINYELPNEPESYVHRIGRTARAGATGKAIAFCDSSEVSFLRDIEKLIGQHISVSGGSVHAQPLIAPTPDKASPSKRPFKKKPHRGRGNGQPGNGKPHSGSGKPQNGNGKPKQSQGRSKSRRPRAA